MERFYVTTPIYYVNDRPHIGHCYTTLLADVTARAERLLGREVFFLTGTDEHAEKVVKSAADHKVSPIEWADRNAAEFRKAFAAMNFSNDDFVRTTEERHKKRAASYIQRLVDSGDIELGDYEGWWDASQEEYLTETVAKRHDFKSPVTNKPLEKRVERNYFFRLDRYEARLREEIDSGRLRILPDARRNEVLGRLNQGLQKVPVSRRIRPEDVDWGIRMPNDPDHRIYVWIEALSNYLTTVDNDARRKFWPADVHMMAKDILWFHAVIWPAMLLALHEPLPRTVYAHGYFVADGVKMSKSLGNFIEIDRLEKYAERFHRDAVRWYLATQGPTGASDADFAYGRFVDVYNSELANGVGNAVSRVASMVQKYFGGALPALATGVVTAGDGTTFDLRARAAEAVRGFVEDIGELRLDVALRRGIGLVEEVDRMITATRPFTLAKAETDAAMAQVGEILTTCAESLRIATLLLAPAMPEKSAEVWRNWNVAVLADPRDANARFVAPLAELAAWGGAHSMREGHVLEKGDALFLRADPTEPAPASS